MQLPDIQKNNIQDFLNSEEIILETIQQITKDFGMFGLEITFSGKVTQAYHEIQEQLVHNIEVLFDSDLSKLYAILYQVDISNASITKAQEKIPEYSLIEVIAHQIIVRELQKVLTRRYFKAL